jgi:hypothetical protein
MSHPFVCRCAVAVTALLAGAGCQPDYTFKPGHADVCDEFFADLALNPTIACAPTCKAVTVDEAAASAAAAGGFPFFGVAGGAGAYVDDLSAAVITMGDCDDCAFGNLACEQQGGDVEVCTESFNECLCLQSKESDIEACGAFSDEAVMLDCMELAVSTYETCLEAADVPPPPSPPVVTGAGRRRVSRSYVTYWMDHVGFLQAEVGISWHRNIFGRVDGIAPRSVPPGSALAQMGLRTGDVIISMNDVPLTTLDNALAALDRSRVAARWRVQVRRAGALTTLVYDIMQ